MPTTVCFQGTAFTKKRKRMNGTNNVKKAEIKQWNPRGPNELDGYGGVKMSNLLTRTLNLVTSSSSWLPQRIYMPSVGAASYQRIGKRIFLKYLRFKGYVMVYQKMIVGVRWRLRLLRTDNYVFTTPADAQRAQEAIIQYLQLYRNNETYAIGEASWDNANSIRTISTHNYYKTIKNVDNNNIMSSKIIASGYIPYGERDVRVKYEGSLTGNSAGVISLSGFQHYNSSFDGGRYCIPLDVKVKCNDYVNDEDVRYYYVLETDCGCGINYSADGEPFTTMATANPLFEVSFFIRGYFTDC